jgi:hypothetical protein
VWGGASLVLASAVAFAVVTSMAGEREAVLAVVADLPAGHVIEARDVREVQVAADAGVVPAGQAETVVGQVATVPLAAGSLLAPGQVGNTAAYPPEGHSEVSFAIATGDAPPLEQGQRVAVFDARDEAPPVAEEGDDVVPVVGTVTGIAADDSTGGGPVVVTMVVESAAAQRAAGVERPRVVVLPAPQAENGASR